MSIEPSGSHFLDYTLLKLLTVGMPIMLFIVALVEIRDGYLGVGLVLMAMFLSMAGILILSVSPPPRNEYDMPFPGTIGMMAIGASIVIFVFGLWFLKNPPVGP